MIRTILKYTWLPVVVVGMIVAAVLQPMLLLWIVWAACSVAFGVVVARLWAAHYDD